MQKKLTKITFILTLAIIFFLNSLIVIAEEELCTDEYKQLEDNSVEQSVTEKYDDECGWIGSYPLIARVTITVTFLDGNRRVDEAPILVLYHDGIEVGDRQAVQWSVGDTGTATVTRIMLLSICECTPPNLPTPEEFSRGMKWRVVFPPTIVTAEATSGVLSLDDDFSFSTNINVTHYIPIHEGGNDEGGNDDGNIIEREGRGISPRTGNSINILPFILLLVSSTGILVSTIQHKSYSQKV